MRGRRSHGRHGRHGGHAGDHCGEGRKGTGDLHTAEVSEVREDVRRVSRIARIGRRADFPQEPVRVVAFTAVVAFVVSVELADFGQELCGLDPLTAFRAGCRRGVVLRVRVIRVAVAVRARTVGGRRSGAVLVRILNGGQSRERIAACGLREDFFRHPPEAHAFGARRNGRGVDFLRHAAVALAPEEDRSVFARHGRCLVGAEKSGRAPERLTARRPRRVSARVHELRAPDVLLEKGLHVGTALASGTVTRKEHPFAGQFLSETVRHQVPGLHRPRHRGHPTRKREDAPLTARTPVERVERRPEQRRRAVNRTRPTRSGGGKERGVGREKERRHRVVPQGIELRQVGEVPGSGFEAPRVGDGLRNEEPRRLVPVHVPEGRATTGVFRAARAGVIA